MPLENKTLLVTILSVSVGIVLVFCSFPVFFILALILNGISGKVADRATVYAARNNESLRVLEHSTGRNLPDKSTISRETHGGVVALPAGTHVYSLGRQESSGHLTTKIFVKDGKYKWSILLVPDKYVSSLQFPGVTEYP